jgi:Na+-transporting NADH:ubiquinone oxidoreductase subunit A
MSNDIRIKKGLSIKLKGAPENVITKASVSPTFCIKPTDFHSVTPKLVVKEGDRVEAGDPVFYSKYQESIQFVAPVSGTIQEVKRGAKRKILEVIIQADKKNAFKKTSLKDLNAYSSEELKEVLLASGCWPFIKQRPYDVIANPSKSPKSIFISSFSTAPLAVDYQISLTGQEAEFQMGIDVLKKLTEGPVHLSVPSDAPSFFNAVQNVEIHQVSGVHPAGNVGVQIHHVDPINAGETVWVVNPADVAIIGRFFKTGTFDAQRIIALSGSGVSKPHYLKTTIGARISSLLEQEDIDRAPQNRIINGDVLTGDAVSVTNYLGFYNNTVSVIPEGKNHRMFGWLPFVDNHIHSMSKTSLSWLFGRREFVANTNLNGEERALVVTGEMERVLPMDILPMQLLKECMSGNIEKMENLGIYEVAPEDFGLIDYVSTSKIEAQSIIRESLDLLLKEVG